MKKSISLVVGNGQVGKALVEVLSLAFRVRTIDVEPTDPVLNPEMEEVEVMHICFPPSKDFVKHVKAYQKRYNPRYTVIHSSVPVGTSRKCNAFHSPIRGVHPNLAEGIMKFVKFLAPESEYLKRYFRLAGVEVMEVARPETTEALKLWDTTYYGWNIIFEKLLFEWCKKHRVDFDAVYNWGNRTYNEGYEKLGRPEVRRPVLRHFKGEIGGHCVLPNLEFLKDSPIATFINQHNEKFKMPKVQKTARKGR